MKLQRSSLFYAFLSDVWVLHTYFHDERGIPVVRFATYSTYPNVHEVIHDVLAARDHMDDFSEETYGLS